MSAFVDDPAGFLQNVLGACSITKTVLVAHDLIPDDPNDRTSDYRGDLDRMEQLCRQLDVPAQRLADLRTLLFLLDRFVMQGRRATPDQATQAEELNRTYVAWCLKEFFEPTE